MSESVLSQNLQHLIKLHGNVSVSDLARLTKIPQPTIHHMLFGATKNPRKKALEALSRFFSVSIEQLVGEAKLPQVIPDHIKQNLQLKTVPVIEKKILQGWPKNKDRSNYKRELLIEKETTPNAFALLIEDSYMEPAFSANTLLIFDLARAPQDRDFTIVRTGDDNQILFNRLFIENNEFYLKQSLDDGNMQLIKLNKANDEILGILIEARVQY